MYNQCPIQFGYKIKLDNCIKKSLIQSFVNFKRDIILTRNLQRILKSLIQLPHVSLSSKTFNSGGMHTDSVIASLNDPNDFVMPKIFSFYRGNILVDWYLLNK